MNINEPNDTIISVEAKIPYITYTDINRKEYEDKTTLHGSFAVESTSNTLELSETNIVGQKKVIPINSATKDRAGIMSSIDKQNLDNSTVNQIEWTYNSHINSFVTAGIYNIFGQRTNKNDGLPISNVLSEHSINARLEVFDSSIPYTSKDTDKCITQKITLSNRVAGDGDVYIRTGRGRTYNSISWGSWGKLLQNIEVDSVDTFDNLIDNGIYSGVFSDGGAGIETFVLIVINDYALTPSTGIRRISQFKYSVDNTNGVVSYLTRVGSGNPVNWDGWKIINKDNISSMINAEIKKVIGTAPDTLDTLQEIAEWVNAHEDLYTTLKDIASQNTVKINTEVNRAKAKEKELNDLIDLNYNNIIAEEERAIQAENEIKAKALHVNTLHFTANADNVRLGGKAVDGNATIAVNIPTATTESAGVMSAADKVTLDKAVNDIAKNKQALTDEVEKLKDGYTIVGQAREIHSRNGKNDSASFLVRTTAGSGTIGDGVATLKSVGGNIVKNLMDDTMLVPKNQSATITINNGICVVTNEGKSYSTIGILGNNTESVNHKYYIHCNIYASNIEQDEIIFGVANVAGLYPNDSYVVKANKYNGWQSLSEVVNNTPNIEYYGAYNLVDSRSDKTTPLRCCKFLRIDLTEMFGETKANKMTKEECDKLFGTMDVLPQGLSIANPSVFKSTGWNQFNPDMVLEGKVIKTTDDEGNVIAPAIDNGDKTLTIIPCLPCKIGDGENNGYHIHGDGVDKNTKVYLTPLNPMDVDGELYMHELTLSEKGTYVPLIKGYMIVEVPTTANLCAHFLWSEDCDKNAYEPYYESVVELPRIPEMNEYGLAGIQSRGVLACDEIDLVNGVYRKKIGAVNFNDLEWKYNATNKVFYVLPEGAPTGYYTVNVFADKYLYIGYKGAWDVNDNKVCWWRGGTYGVAVKDDAYTNITSFKSANAGVMLYYELAEPIEYPLPKVNNNYISSDYGVEQFDGVVPCNANNLYHMRSLAGETRNFLDRLMAGLDTTDATTLADRILAVVNPVVEPINEIDS